jgi:hypothetical protein
LTQTNNYYKNIHLTIFQVNLDTTSETEGEE